MGRIGPISGERWRGKVALVTGAARGIGLGIARHLVACGMRVWIADCNRAGGEAAAAALAQHGDVRCIACDVACEADVRAMIDSVKEHGGRLDALVCNAGIGGPFGTPLEEVTLEQWNRVLAVNLTGCFLCAKYAAPLLRTARGAVVTIASTRALQSEPHTEPYSASKGGIVALTHALAISLGPDVRVNCISPGWIDVRAEQPEPAQPEPLRPEDQQQHPAGRVGTAEDIAALTAFLLSDAAGFITGQNFVVDGGMTRKMIYVP